MDTQILIDRLRESLPPVFTRKIAGHSMPGLFTAHTLANLDSKGIGPGGVILGRRTIYEREQFLAWLEARLKKDTQPVPPKGRKTKAIPFSAKEPKGAI